MLFALPIPQHGLKVSVINRVIAKLIDVLILVAMAAILPYPLGPILGFLYSLFGDGIQFGGFHGQSLGKRIMRLKVVHLTRRKPCTLRESALRNAPVGVATFFAIIPVWGWLILGLIGIPLMIMEVYLMLSVEKGHRLGDVMGDTEVVEVGKGE
jgi:uncharacterized RDD family membrane protein YckC